VVAVRQVAVPGLGPLEVDRLNGIAVSPDVTRLRVTVSGTLPEFLQPSPGRYKDPWWSQRQGDRYEISSVLAVGSTGFSRVLAREAKLG
jgi:hypothetical protein